MTKSANSLIGKEKTLLLDTSVIINLHASGYGERILQILPNKIAITKNVKDELTQEKSRKFLKFVLDHELVSVATMNEIERELYLKLTIDEQDSGIDKGINELPSIDVGEASIISVAKFRFNNENCIPVIDDEKGRMHAKKLLNCGYLGFSIDIFLDPFVISELGASDSTESIFQALKVGGMRILGCHYEQVVRIIGKDRAKECNTLSKLNKQFGVV